MVRNNPRKSYRILEAKEGYIAIETKIGRDYRFSIPTSIRHLINTEEEMIIIIKRR